MTRIASVSYLFILLSLTLTGAASAGNVFTATSPEHRVALLELYTSQGCSSCPPTDQWVTSLKDKGLANDKLIPISLHVDYWDYIGWKDPFADPAHTKRQRDTGVRNRLRTIYTPQLVLDGKDFRRRGAIRSTVGAITAEPSAADLMLSASYQSPRALAAELRVTMDAGQYDRSNRAFIALVENGLETAIPKGENAGRKLHYEHVVRELAGPFKLDKSGDTLIGDTLEIGDELDRDELQLIAFVQNEEDGTVLQTVLMPLK